MQIAPVLLELLRKEDDETAKIQLAVIHVKQYYKFVLSYIF